MDQISHVHRLNPSQFRREYVFPYKLKSLIIANGNIEAKIAPVVRNPLQLQIRGVIQLSVPF